MHGNHRPLGIDKGDTFRVTDIWPTIQGEGPFAGRPAVFVRLAGCNLRCRWCDTDWDDQKDPLMTVDDIVDRIFSSGPRPGFPSLVVITGGEPLRYVNLDILCRALTNSLCTTVQIETAGTLISQPMKQVLIEDSDKDNMLAGAVNFVVSPKIAVNKFFLENVYAPNLFWKYVVGATDELWEGTGIPKATTQINNTGIPDKVPNNARIYLQPRDDFNPELNMRNINRAVELCLTYNYRLSLQQHKIIGVQ